MHTEKFSHEHFKLNLEFPPSNSLSTNSYSPYDYQSICDAYMWDYEVAVLSQNLSILTQCAKNQYTQRGKIFISFL